ncbi:MAG: DUF488 family protein [Spirochaetes bacterium]|nr:DUF488 family protein [Spirochaetota bacterium]
MQPKLPQFYRQKLLLSLINKFNNRLSNSDFQKLLFIFSSTKKENSEYYFVPVSNSPFSFMAQADINRLGTLGMISNNNKLELLFKSNIRSYIKQSDNETMDRLSYQFSTIDSKSLDEYIFSKHPFYSGNPSNQKETGHQNNDKSFYSIGYEGKTIDQYLLALVANKIVVLIDVRKNPISMKYGFSKKTLSSACSELNIKYIHIPGLGIPSQSRQNLKTISDYQRLFDTYEKNILAKSDDLLKQIYQQYENNKKIAITCFESDIKMCHRSRILNKLNKEYSAPIQLL